MSFSFGVAPINNPAGKATSTQGFSSTANKSNFTQPTKKHDEFESMATIPPYSQLFPRLKHRQAVLSCLERWETGHHSQDGGTEGLDAKDLIRLLSTSGASEEVNNASDGVKPIGCYLSNPTDILKFQSGENDMRNALMQCASSDNTSSSTNYGSGLFGPNQTTPAKQVCITLHEKLTVITPSIAKEVLILSDELHLSILESVALYAEANAFIVSNSRKSDSAYNYIMDVDKREFDYQEEKKFVDLLVKGGRVGFGADKNGSQQQQVKEDWTLNPARKQILTSATKTSKVIHTARHLFFSERSALLTTVIDLIRHRLLAADAMVDADSARQSSGNSFGDQKAIAALTPSPHPIICATDQLLQSGLVLNLVKTIREMNDQINSIRFGLKHLRREKENIDSSMRTGINTGGAALTSVFGMGGMFGSMQSTSVTGASQLPPLKKKMDMEYALLGFTQMHRHIAAECLFYLAYHTQLTSEEVISMIDLIKDLTNGDSSKNDEGLPLLDPLIKDVPNPYEEALDSLSAVAEPWQQQHLGTGSLNKPPLKVKDPKQWEEELISNLWGRGQPQLLQCVSTLIMSVMCALDARHVLVERETHCANTFGTGNALLPPFTADDTSTFGRDIQSIHSKLDPENQNVEQQWKRRDVWGVLLVSYALLLRNSAGPQLLSPSSTRGGSRLSPSHSNVIATYSNYLMVASQLKSLTFARVSLIPSFGVPSVSSMHRLDHYAIDSSSVDFYLAVFADFTAQFIDALCATGNMPITRKEWYDEEFNLAQTEWAEKEQRRQFGVWAGQSVDEEANEPREVNIMDRPDCLEDIIALVSSICLTHPKGAQHFWKIVEHHTLDGSPLAVVRLAPSRFLERLDLIHAESDSILFIYISFLASLSLADGPDDDDSYNGASVVHSFLCNERSIHNTHSERHTPFCWENVLNAIRWYAEQLTPYNGEDSNKKSSTDSIRRSTSGVEIAESSTAYYYGISAADSSNNDPRPPSSPEMRLASSSVDPNNQELDESSRNTLVSVLCLVSNVTARSSDARRHILEIQLPGQSTSASGEINRGGSLEILFSLLTTPIPPDIRGLTFMAIANLLQPIPTDVVIVDENTAEKRAGLRAWELLEFCQPIPINVLENGSLSPADGTAPPVSSFGRNQNLSADDLPIAVFPPSTEYGMIYQLEHVERETGRYPSTEGFMYLLTTLISTVGCPSDLGSQLRVRSGCSPYVEFVVNFVLPRATGSFKNVKSLPFATVVDETRLINRALEVIEAVLVRYTIPFATERIPFDEFKIQYRSFINVAKQDPGVSLILPEILGNADLLDEVVINEFTQDFKNVYVKDGESETSVRSRNEIMLESSVRYEIPRPKTPGFFVLFNLLADNKGPLFNILHQLLSRDGGPYGVNDCGENMTSRLLATALFREMPPNLDTSKRGADYKTQNQRHQVDMISCEKSLSALRQTMIQSVVPTILLSCSDSGCSGWKSRGESANDAVLWRERIILLTLRILCAAAAREELFTQLLKNTSLSFVPTLSFKGPIHGSCAHRLMDEQKVYVSKLSSLFTKSTTAASQPEILKTVVEYVGYGAISLMDHQAIAKNSFCIISYIAQTFPQSRTIRLLCGEGDKIQSLSRSFSSALSMQMTEGEDFPVFHEAILDMMLSNIGIDTSPQSNLTLRMLGAIDSRDSCLKVILGIQKTKSGSSITNLDFVLDPRTSSCAMKCYELIFRLMQLGDKKTQSILRDQQFWHNQVIRYLGTRDSSTPSILNEISNCFRSNIDNELESKRNNHVLHSISWLLKGLALELYSLIQDSDFSKYRQPKIPHLELFVLLLSHRKSLIRGALVELPLGVSNNDLVRETLNAWAPTHDVLRAASIPMRGPTDVCSQFQVIDCERMFRYRQRGKQKTEKDIECWAAAWNSYVSRICACTHISKAWSDLIRTMVILSPLVEGAPSITSAVADILSTILLRLNTPDKLNEFGQLGVLYSNEEILLGSYIEAESATPLCSAALCLADFISLYSLVNSESPEYVITEEECVRIRALAGGAISSFTQISTGDQNNDERIRILRCVLSQMETI